MLNHYIWEKTQLFDLAGKSATTTGAFIKKQSCDGNARTKKALHRPKKNNSNRGLRGTKHRCKI